MSVAAAAGDVKAGLTEVPKNIIKRPLFTAGVIVGVMVLVLLVEAFKPGLITNPIRRFLNAVGVKSA